MSITLDEVLTGVQHNFTEITSLYAETSVTKHLMPPYLDIEPGVNLSQATTFNFNYWEKGSSFRYEVDSTIKERQGLIALHARNGDLDQYYTMKNGGMLVLSHREIDKEWLSSDNAVLQPYGFLYHEIPGIFSDYAARMPSLADLKNPDLLKSLLTNTSVKLLSMRPNAPPDIATILITIKGGEEKQYQSGEYSYEVYLSKQYHWFPVGYRKRNKDGILIQEVFCSQITQEKDTTGGIPFIYSKKVQTWEYNKKGQLLLTVDSIISKLTFNAISDAQEEQLFNIDPGTAKVIYDKDKNVYIKVPL